MALVKRSMARAIGSSDSIFVLATAGLSGLGLLGLGLSFRTAFHPDGIRNDITYLTAREYHQVVSF